MVQTAVFAADSAPTALGPGVSASPTAVEPPEGPTFTLDERGHIRDWHPAAEALYGFEAREVVGRRPAMLVPPELDLERDDHVREALNGRLVPGYETERMRKDGSRLEVTVALSPIRDMTGRIVGASVYARELARSRDAVRTGSEPSSQAGSAACRERSRRRLAEAQERFRIAFLHAPNGIALLSTAPGSEGYLLDANPALGRQLGYESDDLIGRCLLDFMHPEAGTDEPEDVGALLAATDAEIRAERRFLRRDGREVWLQIGASVVRDDSGRPLYAVAHMQDVTDARRHAAELRHLADHDGLTGLVNRRCFGARLEAALDAAREAGRTATVLVVDLDNFKVVNDTYGHAVGDELLRRVALALSSRVRAGDVVGRLGGDEFGILLADVTPDQARAVAAELLAAVDREGGVPDGDAGVRVTASIGVSTLDASTPKTGEALLSEADTAMYEAKKTGRNRFATSDDAERRAVAAARSRRPEGIAAAAASGRLELWEQPLLPLGDATGDRIELLARMRGRRGEAVTAGRFVPLMKRFGRVQDLDRWVVEAAVALVARRQRAGVAGDVEINLDATSIADERFVDWIHMTLATASVDAREIVFGVTAAASISEVGCARRLMSSLRSVGCRFALDNFGASAGSLRDLKHLPFDAVKIDGELIAELPARRFDQLAVRAIADVARGSGLVTVAEHVADDATLDLLRGYGIDYAQGFHVGLPRPATVPEDVLAAA